LDLLAQLGPRSGGLEHSAIFNAEPSGARTVTDRWAWRGQSSTSSDWRLSGWNG